MYKPFRLGCDPETFLKDKNGKIISAIGRFGGTKHNPRPILPNIRAGFAIQEDNVLLEYNLPPADSFDEFHDYLGMAQGAIHHLIKPMELEMATIASCSMPEDQMEDPQAFVFGCDPDYDAWNLVMNPKPSHPDRLFRSAGGHLHVGCKLDRIQCITLCRMLDRFVGTWLSWRDPDKNRQALYGKPGSMRFKPYGMEYRTPSNWWTYQASPVLEELYERVGRAISATLENPGLLEKEKFTPKVFSSPEEVEKWAKA